MEKKKTYEKNCSNEIINKVKPNMPETKVLYELSDFFKVMGDSTRIQLLWALEESEMCVNIIKYDKICCFTPVKGIKNSETCKARQKGKKCILCSG